MDFCLSDPTWICAIVIILFLGFVFYRRWSSNDSYWKVRGVLHEPAKSAFQALYDMFNKQILDMEIERYKKYGRIYGVCTLYAENVVIMSLQTDTMQYKWFEGKVPVLSVADPDLIRNILVKDFPSFAGRRQFPIDHPILGKMITSLEGETWKRVRSIISPAFSTGKIKRMTDIILSCAKTLACIIDDESDKPIDAKKFYQTYTMDVIASTAFATKIHSHQDTNNRFLQEAKKFIPTKIPLKFILLFIFPLKFLLFMGFEIVNNGSLNFLKEETLKIIKHRKESGETRNDFLQLLLEVEEETRNERTKSKVDEVKETTDDINAADLGHEENNAQLFKIQKSTKFLTNDELIAQCVIFFLAGYITTSTTIAFASYMLALNPEIQDKLREEVDEVINNHDGKLTYAGIQEMVYLDRVVSETLRMFPPTIRVDRVAGEDYKLGDTGITVEKGTLVLIPHCAIHQDPEHYPEPEKFIPDRFTAEGKASRHPYSYLAFGAGPRNCVAMRFALMEVKICLAYVTSQFIVKPCSQTKVPLDIVSSFGTLDPKEVMLSFKKRENRVFEGLEKNGETED